MIFGAVAVEKENTVLGWGPVFSEISPDQPFPLRTLGTSGSLRYVRLHNCSIWGFPLPLSCTLITRKQKVLRLNISLLAGLLGRVTINIGNFLPSLRNCPMCVIVKPMLVNSFLTNSSSKELGIPLSRTLS